LSSFARDRALAAAEMEKIIADLKVIVVSVADTRLGINETTARDLKTTITSSLSAFHSDHAEAPGLDIEQLRRTCAPRFPASLFRALLQIFAEARDLSIEGAAVRLPTHSVQLRPQDEKLFGRIKPLLSGTERFRPPRVRDIATTLSIPEQQVRTLCKQLAKLARLDEVAPDHFFLRTTVAEIAQMLPGLAAAAPGGEFSAAQLRDRLDNGRKVAIQILEFFDRHGVTARRGDLRRINPQRINLFGPTTEASKPIAGKEASPVGVRT
jgi:selenocysteine-specific elongation factor